MTKEKLIRKIKKLAWGDILYGYDSKGNLININDYNEEQDVFTGYNADCKPLALKFEQLPSNLRGD